MKNIDTDKAFDYCKGCVNLRESLQIQYGSNDEIMKPYCAHYELHFVSVQQIDQRNDTRLHYDEGYI